MVDPKFNLLLNSGLTSSLYPVYNNVLKNNDVIEADSSTLHFGVHERSQQTLRQGILDDASYLLTHEGPQALSMRRIAQIAGCSTMVLYTLFASKQGLVNELYLKGFSNLRQALEAVPPDEESIEKFGIYRHTRISMICFPNWQSLANIRLNLNFLGVNYLPGFISQVHFMMQPDGNSLTFPMRN